MIKLQKSTFFNEEETKKKLCSFIFRANALSMGEECRKFEDAFAKKQGRKYSVYVNSGSSANLLLIQGLLNLGILKKGDIVAVSALTWATNIMPLIQLGLQPILVDCEITTLNISPRTLQNSLDMQPNIKAVFITNTLGHCDNMAGLARICNDHKILFIEDNCESLGSIIDGVNLGNWGTASTFSFFVGHHLSTIEGGMVCTDDITLYEELVMARAHGWDRNLSNEAQKIRRSKHNIGDFYAKYTFYDLAYNIRPTEINGFIGNIQITYWDHIVETRYNNFIRLHDVIEQNNDLIPLSYKHMDLVSSFAIPVIVRDIERLDYYKSKFGSAKVEYRPMIAGSMARQPFFRKYIGNPGTQPNADFIHKNSFYFGNNPELSESEIGILRSLLTV